jgi:AcrR family transcriptional regulator
VATDIDTAAVSLPPAPPPAADPYLDAAARCFLRYGVRRTSMQDIAAEAGVERTTVYRQVGTKDSILRLLTARELHRHLGEAIARADLAGADVPRRIVRLLAEMCAIVREHPVMAKVLADERDLLASARGDVGSVFERIAAVIAPAIDAGMRDGRLARRDPVVVAQWLARISATVVLAPPAGELEPFLAEILIPALEPD